MPQITLALIAHDQLKPALADFAREQRPLLSRFRLVATRGTGTLVRNHAHLPVELLDHGLAGGDVQLRRLAEAEGIQAVILFRDPEPCSPFEPDYATLLTVCDRQRIPLATNAATAQAILYFLTYSPDRGVVTADIWGRVAAPSPVW